jgi:2,4-dienoyl-CoA reductase-like NADH-dependent reductase (Old Yellow Enzyme family)
MSGLLFKPIKIRNLALKNRIVMAPMATHFATLEGQVTERLKHYYATRARGGVAMIVSESCYVHPEGRGGSNRLSICSDEAIPGLKELAAVVHVNGAKIAAQLHHGGRQISPASISQYPVSASSTPCI